MMPKEPEPLWCVCGHANYQHPITNYPSGPNQLPEERSDCEECEECVEFVRDYDLSHMDEEHVHWVPQPVSFEDVLKAGPALTPEGNKAPRRLGLSPEEQAEGVGEEFILQARQWGKGKAEEEHLGHGHISANPNDGPDQARAYTDRVEEELQVIQSKDMSLFVEHLKKRGEKPEVPHIPNRAERRKTARQVKRQMKKRS